jgi:predicted ATPase
MAGKRQGQVTYETHYLGLLAEVLVAGQDFSEALRVLDEALELVEPTGEKYYAPELYRLRGDVFLASGNGSDLAARTRANEDFRRSLDLAREQSARSLELRAAMSLVEIERRFGTDNDGHGIFANVYAAFTEGFETEDLRRAQSMLQAVGNR